MGGSEQQQVTCYHHKDANNEWIVYKPWDKLNETKPDGEVEFIKDGDVIRLGKIDMMIPTFLHNNYSSPSPLLHSQSIQEQSATYTVIISLPPSPLAKTKSAPMAI